MQTVRIADHEYPLALTVGAALQMMEKYEDIRAAIAKLQSRDKGDAMSESLYIAAILMQGGADHAKLCKGESTTPPTYKDLLCMAFPADLPAIRAAALEAIVGGLKREIEVEPGKKKETILRK
nr:MAG TPA: hypothetical protein [Caudoviricetes sp.]